MVTDINTTRTIMAASLAEVSLRRVLLDVLPMDLVLLNVLQLAVVLITVLWYDKMFR